MASVVDLSPMNFNPLLQGMQTASQFGNLSRQGLQLHALQQTMPGQIAAQNAQNQATANTAVPNANAQLGLSQARIPMMQAQTGLIQQSTRLAPLTAATQAQNSVNMQNRMSQMGSRFGQAYQLSKMLQSMARPAAQAWIAQNQNQYNSMLSTLAQPQPQNSLGSASLLTPQLFKNTLGYAPVYVSQPQTAMATSQTAQSVNQNGPQNAQVAQIARANQMQANKELTTPQQQNRYESGVALEKFLNRPDMSTQLDKIGQYAGLDGGIQKLEDMLNNSPRYTSYKSAVSQMGPILSGGISQLEGFAKTNQGLNEGLNYFKRARDLLGNDPVQAQQYINTGKQILSAELASIKSSAQPLFSVNRSPNSPDIMQPTAHSAAPASAKPVTNDPLGIR